MVVTPTCLLALAWYDTNFAHMVKVGASVDNACKSLGRGWVPIVNGLTQAYSRRRSRLEMIETHSSR